MSSEAPGITDFLIEDEDRILTSSKCPETSDYLVDSADAGGGLVGASIRFEATEDLNQAINNINMTESVIFGTPSRLSVCPSLFLCHSIVFKRCLTLFPCQLFPLGK